MTTPKIKALDIRPTRPRHAPSKSFAPSPQPGARQYAAAQYTSMTGAWSPGSATVNEELLSSAVLVRDRVRQLVRDNPHFQRATRRTADFLVGSGIRYQSKIVDEDGNLLKKLNQYIEDRYDWWLEKKRFDIAGHLHGYDFQTLDSYQNSECGEFLLIRRIDTKAEMPLKYQTIEPDQLIGYEATGSNETSMGIEYNPNTWQRVRFHFLDDAGRAFSVPAEQIVHGFHTLRSNQLRGISPFTAGVLIADAFGQYVGSELSRKAMAARYLGIVQSPDPLRFQRGLSTNTAGTKLEEVENASFQYLQPTETITFPTPPNDAGIADFTKIMLEMYSVATGIPYEVLTQDYGNMSFSTAKIKRTDFRNELKPAFARYVRTQCEPIKQDFFRFGTLSGYLDLPGYEKNPMFYQRGVWQSPGMEPVDLLREVKATIEEIKAGLRAPQDYIRAYGGDPEDVLQQISNFKKIAMDIYGIDLDAGMGNASTMMQQNPAKITGDQGDEG